ncbi:hypothetical protein GXB78_04325 [Pseudomonas moraviensis subsp. stanleyae]|uniref:hypothetical protein n=1 Tax=Pseudomonas moraviensis TaxID=321662 RepID=UPI002E53EE36|nr:hypothetical protein [Pseudomonas moraviensis subsp. stanleyae]
MNLRNRLKTRFPYKLHFPDTQLSFFTTRQLFNQCSMLRKLRRQFCSITYFHIGKIKPWRNRFADQAKAVSAFEQFGCFQIPPGTCS